MNGLVTQPRFITLEGGEGAGKSTVLNALRDVLMATGAEVLCTREEQCSLSGQQRMSAPLHHAARDQDGIAHVADRGDRTEALKQVRVPTLVIHGEVDPLVTLSGGQATGAAIPGAELLVIPGMGHDLPPEATPRIVEAIVANVRKAAQPAAV